MFRSCYAIIEVDFDNLRRGVSILLMKMMGKNCNENSVRCSRFVDESNEKGLLRMWYVVCT